MVKYITFINRSDIKPGAIQITRMSGPCFLFPVYNNGYFMNGEYKMKAARDPFHWQRSHLDNKFKGNALICPFRIQYRYKIKHTTRYLCCRDMYKTL